MSAPLIWSSVRGHAQQAAAGPELRHFSTAEQAPPSDSQLRLLQFDQLRPGSTAQNLTFAYRLHGPIDAAALERALAAVWARHEALRAYFPDPSRQRFHDASSWHMRRRRAAAGDAEAAAYAGARALAEEPFALDRDLLLRAALFAIGDDDHLLAIAVHHIVFDAWSLDLLHRELSAGYRGDRLPALRATYGQYAAWQRARTADPLVIDPLREHWSHYLAGHPSMARLDGALPRATAPGRRRRRSQLLDASVVGPLRDLAAERGTSLFAVLFAACAALVAERTGERDFVLLSPTAGRTAAALYDLIGYFVNLHALRADLRDAPDFATLLDRCARGTADALEHQELPTRMAASLYGQSPQSAPLLFGLQNTPARPLELEGVDVTAEQLECCDADVGLYLNVEPLAGGELTVLATYDDARHDAAGIDALLADYRSILVRYGAEPALALALPEPAGAPSRQAPMPSGSEAPAQLRPELPSSPDATPLDYLRREIALLTGAVEADVDVDRAPIALGLDSLKLIELSTRVRRDLLVEAPLRRYARAPSVRALAEDLLLLLSTRPALAASDDAELFLI